MTTGGQLGESEGRSFFLFRPSGFFLLILLLQAIHIVLRPLLTATVGTDDVDQLFFAQSLTAGYSYEQTPLYTWIMWLAVQAFGPTVFTVGLVKYALVFGIHAFTYLAGRQVLNDPRLQVVAGLSPMTFYPIGWRLHEADTYGILATVCMMALVWAALLLLRERRLSHYLALGAALGCGLLSSAYFGIGALALFLAMLAVPQGWRLWLNWRFAVALFVAVVLVSPYAYWIYEHWAPLLERAQALLQGNQTPERLNPWWMRSFRAVVAFILATFPFWVCFFILFYYSLRPLPRGAVREDPVARLLWAYIPLTVLGFIAAAVVLQIHSIDNYRVYPATVPFALLFFWRLERFGLRVSAMRWTWILFALLIVVVVQARFQQIEAGPAFCKVCRMQAPYPEVAQQLRDQGYTGGGTILAGDNYVAGNFRVAFPDTRVVTSHYPEVVPPPSAGTGPCLVIWHEDMRKLDRKLFEAYIAENGIVLPPMQEIPLRSFEVPHTPRLGGLPNREIRMRYVLSQEPLGTCG